ncbi:MAG: sigma-70 region 4 domain-containing protein [Micromonosporaceae bacterium]|nr:sigma-70 region 4 domain-containing protein [Micromonosporaceae bacterium]
MSGPAAAPPAGSEVPVRHGYTMADLERLTRKAALSSRWRFITYGERADVARFAILEHLLTATDPPDFWHLVNVGERAIHRHVEAEEHWGGFWVTRSDVDAGTPMVRFHRYWHGSAGPTRSPENQVVDVLALRQIWPKLTRGQRAALLALARHGDYDTAAAELGISYHTLVSHLHNARKEFLRWWHQHEKPSRTWGTDIRKRDPKAGPNYHTVTGLIRRRERRRTASAAEGDPPATVGHRRVHGPATRVDAVAE